MRKLTPQENKIISLLSDNNWHCGQEINDLYIKDDRKRVSDLIKAGFDIESKKCDLNHVHHSGIVKRRLRPQSVYGLPIQIAPALKPNDYYFSEQYYQDKPKQPQQFKFNY